MPSSADSTGDPQAPAHAQERERASRGEAPSVFGTSSCCDAARQTFSVYMQCIFREQVGSTSEPVPGPGAHGFKDSMVTEVPLL